jgi:hypothetical protein
MSGHSLAARELLASELRKAGLPFSADAVLVDECSRGEKAALSAIDIAYRLSPEKEG